MATLTLSVAVEAPVDRAFDYVLDPRRLWGLPDLAVTDVEMTPDGVGTTARIWSHVLGFHVAGGLEYTEVVRPRRIVIDVGFMIEHPRWTFTFEPDRDGTRLTAQGEWHVRVPAVGRTFERMMVRAHEEFLETMLDTLKAQVEAPATV
jgi:uncharacterized protein YndB with AHSA1/START domain